MRWPWQKKMLVLDNQKLAEERAKTQLERAAMSEAAINFSRERHELDEMVRRSLALLEERR